MRDALREDVAKDAEDPWFVVPWASACVRGAELAAAAGQQTTALELLQPALAHLEAMRGLTHADQWDEPLCRDGLRLAAELQFATGRR